MEGALVDRSAMTLAALEPSDPRTIDMQVAGPAALLVSKIHKIAERQDDTGRLRDKDALDIYRILQATETNDLAEAFRRLLGNTLSKETTAFAVSQIPTLLGTQSSPAIEMLVRAVTPIEDGEFRAQACILLANDLFKAIQK